MKSAASAGDATAPTPPGNGHQDAACALVAGSLAALALGALDAEEGAAVRAHLAVCPPCAALAARYDVLAARLAEAVPPVAPPLWLRARLLRQLADAPTAHRAAAAHPIVRLRPSSIARLAAVAAVALLLVSNLVLWQRTRDQGRQLAEIGQGQMEQYDLSGTTAAPRALGMIYVAAGSGRGWLLANDLPALPAGRTYQVWLLKGSGPNLSRVSGGLFTTDPEGRGYLLIQAPSPLSHYDGMGITVEPRGGSAWPTGPPVLRGTMGDG